VILSSKKKENNKLIYRRKRFCSAYLSWRKKISRG
jgi:hypothetical protein